VFNEREARAKGISLCSNDKARVFVALEDHKLLMPAGTTTFKPNPKGTQKHDNNLLQKYLLNLYLRAFGPNRTKVLV